jgi:anaerobic ribonucleoside-triphosphate reductase activating protein
MNLGGVQFPVFKPYEKATFEVYISGCNKKCLGCHNPELQDFNFGAVLEISKLIDFMLERKELFSIISMVGGELLDQNEDEIKVFIYAIKKNFPNKEFWMFTGKSKEEVPDWALQYFDRIKVGHFEAKLKQEGFPASKNQRLLVKGMDY